MSLTLQVAVNAEDLTGVIHKLQQVVVDLQALEGVGDKVVNLSLSSDQYSMGVVKVEDETMRPLGSILPGV